MADLVYFRTCPRVVPLLDEDGRPRRGKHEFIPAREIALAMPRGVAEEITSPGWMRCTWPGLRAKERLDCVYGFAEAPGEILSRNIEWLNANRVYRG